MSGRDATIPPSKGKQNEAKPNGILPNLAAKPQ